MLNAASRTIAPSTLRAALKQLLFGALDGYRSSHIDEALAAGAGYRSHAAYGMDLKHGSVSMLPIDRILVDRMSSRLSSIAKIDSDEVLPLIEDAIRSIAHSMPGQILPIGPSSELFRQQPAQSLGSAFDRLLAEATKWQATSVRFLSGPDGCRVMLEGPGLNRQAQDVDASIPPSKWQSEIAGRLDEAKDFWFHYEDCEIRGRAILKAKDELLRLDLRLGNAPFPSLDKLSITDHRLLKDACSLPRGVVIVGSATGQGATTTMLSMIREMKAQGRKVVVISDYDEYRVDTVRWVNSLDHAAPSHMMEAVLRSAPDAIVIDTLRNDGMPLAAFLAAEVGNLVVAGMRENHGPSIVRELTRMGVAESLVDRHLRMVSVQMLVGARCESCRRHKADRSRSCWECRSKGGRTALSSIHVLEDPAAVQALRAIGSGHDMRDEMLPDAIRKAELGVIPWSYAEMLGADRPSRR